MPTCVLNFSFEKGKIPARTLCGEPGDWVAYPSREEKLEGRAAALGKVDRYQVSVQELCPKRTGLVFLSCLFLNLVNRGKCALRRFCRKRGS